MSDTVLTAKIEILRTTGTAIASETLSAGRVVYLTDEEAFVVGDGSTVGASLSRNLDVDRDASPQLGGDLDVNGHEIVSASNADIIIQPNGTGALALQPAGTTAYGDGAVDLSQYRSADANVASGAYSFVEGYDNKAQGSYSHAEGSGTVAVGNNGTHAEGYSTIASGGYGTHAEGKSTTAIGANGAHAEGCETTAFAASAHAEGISTTAYVTASHAEGDHTYAGGPYSHAGGSYAKTTKECQFAHAAGMFNVIGDAQQSAFVVRASVTHDDADWHSLYLNGSSSTLGLTEDSAWCLFVKVTGATQGLGKTFAYVIVGHVENDGGTMALKSQTKLLESDADDSDFDAQLAVTETGDALEVQVKDSTSGEDVVQWVASVLSAEVVWAAA